MSHATAEDSVFFRISKTELERRWALVRAHMRARDLDAIVVQGWDDPLSGYIRWLCDFGAQAYTKVILFFADGPMVSIEHGGLGGRRPANPEDLNTPGVDTIITTSSFASVAATHLYESEAAAAELLRRDCRRVGLLRPNGMTYGFINHLRQAMPQTEFHDETDALDAIKAVKSLEEQSLLREACAVQDAVFAKVLEAVRPGVRDVDLLAMAEHEYRLLGSEDGTLAAGSAPPGKPAMLRLWRSLNRTIEKGDCFTLLLEMSHPSGYYAEMARQVVVGRATSEHLDAVQTILEAQKATVEQFRPGASCAKIAASHDAFMGTRGQGPELRIYSHSQGYDLVERPMIRRDETMSLEAGMFLSCHPAVATPALFAFICDNYLISADGPAERLHTTPQKLFEL